MTSWLYGAVSIFVCTYAILQNSGIDSTQHRLCCPFPSKREHKIAFLANHVFSLFYNNPQKLKLLKNSQAKACTYVELLVYFWYTEISSDYQSETQFRLHKWLPAAYITYQRRARTHVVVTCDSEIVDSPKSIISVSLFLCIFLIINLTLLF
ncbi:hypothetical protein D920_00198 [Enterococcus faecalis 13-SD-W-01]|nr:hypothetical protein D920_00198 [Enterococcus faecalis 13-SD-W-01]